MPRFLQHKNRLTIWSQKNLGFVGGINIALKALLEVDSLNSEYIVLMNNDTIATKGWLSKMKCVLDNNKNIAIAGPVSSVEGSVHDWKRIFQKINFNYDPNFESWDAMRREMYLSENLTGQFCEALDNLKPPLIKMIAFFASLIRVSVIKEIGILDERFGLGLCDDRDYCKRVYDAGYSCAVALDSYVEHNHSTTFKAEFKTFELRRLHENNIQQFKDKHNL